MVSILSSIPIWYFSRKAKSFSNKDVFLVIVLCWIAASFFGSIPFYLSDSFDGY
jgi:trk system potassium uptake protein TrkH